MTFADRRHAGRQLARRLEHYQGKEGVIVLGLPRGGVEVADEIARALGVSLDILIVRKIGFPGNPELAAGAVSETGTVVINEDIVSAYGVGKGYLDSETATKMEEIVRRKQLFRGGRGIPPLAGRTVILVDDGIATGATVKAAIATLREEKLARLIVAMPVASPEAADEISRTVDEWVCLLTPPGFMAVGGYYHDFTQVEDDEVVAILKERVASA